MFLKFLSVILDDFLVVPNKLLILTNLITYVSIKF